MGEAIYKYTGEGKNRKKTTERVGQRTMSRSQLTRMNSLKNTAEFKNADKAGKQEMLKKAGLLGVRGKMKLGGIQELSASGTRRSSTFQKTVGGKVRQRAGGAARQLGKSKKGTAILKSQAALTKKARTPAGRRLKAAANTPLIGPLNRGVTSRVRRLGNQPRPKVAVPKARRASAAKAKKSRKK